jgi:hypothetical protein
MQILSLPLQHPWNILTGPMTLKSHPGQGAQLHHRARWSPALDLESQICLSSLWAINKPYVLGKTFPFSLAPIPHLYSKVGLVKHPGACHLSHLTFLVISHFIVLEMDLFFLDESKAR